MRIILAALIALVLAAPVQGAIPPEVRTGAGITAAAVAFPVIPDGTPIIGEAHASCDNGVDISKIVYDTDVGGPGGAAVFRRLEMGAVQRMTVQELQGRYARPCDILNGLKT